MGLKRIWHRLSGGVGGFHGGVDVPQNKRTADRPIEQLPLSPVLIVPVKQHIGEACAPLVKVGDYVRRGQKIAQAEGYLAAPVHAPAAGKVVKIEEHRIIHPSGLGLPCIFIEPDGSDAAETLTPWPDWAERDPGELRERVRMCGIVGLGGAVFPTFIKLVRDQHHPIETIILNGVECEPYLTTDHRLMVEQADEIVAGLAVLRYMVGAREAVVAIEDNKPDAIEAVRAALARAKLTHARVVGLPTRYPQGSEKQLIETITGRQVPAGRLPMHVGVLCQNVATARAVYRAVCHGEPLTERVITVSGDAVPNPGNVRVPFGTPVRFLLAERGLTDIDEVCVIHGGPMMGEYLRSVDVPVAKASNGLLAFHSERVFSLRQQEQPCIRCGHCGEVCPVNLVPNLLADHCRNDAFERAEQYQLFDCIECGCCSYVCPASIPLVHYFRYGKGQLAKIRRAEQFAEESRMRSEARERRLEREKQKKAARRQRAKQLARKTDDAGGAD
ncbi:MAG: electron transport complex subunit RsxC [Zetaproteobacteria bacterium]|nr:MAG: electron transport complex subunit RsxC [Zetaproteobacteria bacterium]